MAVVVLDLALTWIGTSVGWLRQLVRVLSMGTVVANAVAGWPDPVAIGLHIAAPLMLLAMIEAGRTVLLRRIGEVHGTRRAPIPLVRWVLAPWRTLLLWRRMALWQITSWVRCGRTPREHQVRYDRFVEVAAQVFDAHELDVGGGTDGYINQDALPDWLDQIAAGRSAAAATQRTADREYERAHRQASGDPDLPDRKQSRQGPSLFCSS